MYSRVLLVLLAAAACVSAFVPLLQQQQRSPLSRLYSNNNDDEQEWNAVMAAFKMYQAAFGDLRIPPRFIVPNVPPWPQQAWGLKLGKVCIAIQNTNRYLDVPSRRALLEEMGFVWAEEQPEAPPPTRPAEPVAEEPMETKTPPPERVMPRQPPPPLDNLDDSFEQALSEAKLPDTPRIPSIGESLPSFDDDVAFSSLLPPDDDDDDAFSSLLPPEPLDEEADSSSSLLPDLLDDDDDADTPAPPPEPLATREAPRQVELPPMLADKKLSANDVRFRNVYTALYTYREIYGNLLIPQPFRVPESPDWPETTWGLRLGARVNAIRSQGTFVQNNPARRELLDQLGFVWSPPKERKRKKENEDTQQQPSALDSIFKGSFDFAAAADATKTPNPTWNFEGAKLPDTVTQQPPEPDLDEYVPPRTLEESMNEATRRAMECGIIEKVTAKKRVVKGKREKDIPWFNDDFGDDFVFDDVVEAFTIYKRLYGDFDNLTFAFDFVVPVREETTGFLDDNELFDIFQEEPEDDVAAPLVDEMNNGGQEDYIATEIKRLQDEAELQADIPQATRKPNIASSDDEWSEHLGGMVLGNICKRIRDGSLEVKHIPERKEKLDAIGFDWGDEKRFIDVPFEKAMCAMYAYYLVRGDMFVAEDFVMPNEDPWPQALAGYELGQAVQRIRELQNFFEAYHPEKVALLRMIDFIWFSDSMALPLDPNEKEISSETLLLSGMGHPDYAKMIDIPMGLPDKILADGPFHETADDPKLWWKKWHNYDYVKDYWYERGRRDNGYALRKMGYPKMAAEHEAKYGPGLFSQIDELMKEIENSDIKTMDPAQRIKLLDRLNEYRKEMLGCKDLPPNDVDKMIMDFDKHMLDIIGEGSDALDYNLDDEDDADLPEDAADSPAEDEDFAIQEEEVNLTDELGLK